MTGGTFLGSAGTTRCTAPFNWMILILLYFNITYHDVTGLKCIQVIYAIVSRTIRLPTPLPLRMWNRFGRVVTLEVCAGVATTLIVATVPCPRINQVLSLPIGPSIHVGRAKTSLSSISPNRGTALLTHHGNAPCGGCLHSYFTYAILTNLPYNL